MKEREKLLRTFLYQTDNKNIPVESDNISKKIKINEE